MRNPQVIEEPSGIESESDFFLKHQKYTGALSFVFFAIAMLLALGSVVIFIVQQEANFGLLLCVFVPGALCGWLRNRSRGIKENQLPHEPPIPF